MNLLDSDMLLNRGNYYEAGVQRPAYAKLEASLRVDAVVIGAGFAGLAAALELADRGMQVAVLEARQVCFGASGRNGGQAVLGYACEQAVLEKALGRDGAKAAWDMSCEAVDWIDVRIARHGIACDRVHAYLHVAENARKARVLLAEARQWQNEYGLPIQVCEGSAVRTQIDSACYAASVFESRSGHLHPLKYGLGLAHAAVQAGVRIFENTPVLSMQRGARVRCQTALGLVHTDFVILAGNCLLSVIAPELAPELNQRVMPVGTYIIGTEVLAPELVQALIPGNASVCNNNFDLDYFRFSADHRLLFGGKVSYTGHALRHLKERMQQRMLRVFPQLRSAEIPYVWGGFVDISMNRAPDFGRVESNIYYLQGFSGHGVALTGLAGRLVAEAIAGQAERLDLFSKIAHRNFPGGARLRVPTLALAMLYYGLRDYF